MVYHANLRPIAAGDSLPASLIPFSILLDHSIALDRFGPYLNDHVAYSSSVLHLNQGHWYSAYPIAGPVLASPLYLPVAFAPGLRRLPPATLVAVARIAEKVVAAALAAATVVALLMLLRRLASGQEAWILALLFALGTGNWSTSSQALWQHTFGQLAIIGCLYSIERMGSGTRWYWAAGAFAGCALAIRPTNVVLLPALALVLWLGCARVVDWLRVFLPAAVAAASLAGYNLAVFHSLAGGYPAQLDGNAFRGLLGILFSPGRGLLLYTPIALFAVAAFLPRARETRQKHRLLVVAATTFSLLHVAVIASWPVWWGGYCWGPRLLTEILAPLMILIAVGLPALRAKGVRRAFAALAVYGVLVQALGVFCYPKGWWDNRPVSVDAAPARLWNWADSPMIRTARAGVAWEPYSVVAALATGGPSAAAKQLQRLRINSY